MLHLKNIFRAQIQFVFVQNRDLVLGDDGDFKQKKSPGLMRILATYEEEERQKAARERRELIQRYNEKEHEREQEILKG